MVSQTLASGRCWTWPRTPNRAGRRSIRGPRPPEPVRFVDTRVRMLLAAGAAPNARDGNGRTPLHRVFRHFDDPVPHARRAIAALLDGGAGTKVRDDFGKMPFDYIKDGERWKETDLYRRLRS